NGSLPYSHRYRPLGCTVGSPTPAAKARASGRPPRRARPGGLPRWMVRKLLVLGDPPLRAEHARALLLLDAEGAPVGAVAQVQVHAAPVRWNRSPGRRPKLPEQLHHLRGQRADRLELLRGVDQRLVLLFRGDDGAGVLLRQEVNLRHGGDDPSSL